MKIMKYICVCLLMGQIFVTPVLSYAEEADQSTGNKVTEESKTSPLPGSEDSSNQPGEHEEGTTNSSENSIGDATTQSEDNVTDESILQEPSDTKSSEFEQEEVRETRRVISSTWGTSPITFDEETGVLTVEAGTLGTFVASKYLDDDKKIIKERIKKIILKEGVKAPENSHLLFAGYGTNLYNVVSISGQLDVSDVKDMSSMFSQLRNLKDLSDLNISSWNIENVTDISSMFFMVDSLRSIDLSGWNTENIVNMNNAFSGFFRVATIKLGENSIFNDTVQLPSDYRVFWDRVIPDTPKSSYLNSDDFMNNYDGSMPGTYILKEYQTTLKVKDSILYVGDKWEANYNFVSATDKDGNVLAVDDLEVEGTVDTSEAGVYEITYKNGSLSEIAKVTVKENKATLKVKDTTLYIGDTWVSKDNFVSATDKEGTELTVGDLEVEGTVDTSEAGVYEITYKNGSLSETAKVTVKENKASLKVKDSTLYVGDKWASKDNLVSATDKEGTELTVGDLEVEGTVDTSKAGVYEITYKNGSLSEIAKVTVKENKATLKVKDSTLYVGDTWVSKDNFVSATDKEGTELTVGDLEVEGTVDTSTAGEYEITYKNGSLSETAKVTVKENKASLKVKDSTLYVGDKWASKDNFVSATDKDGNVLTVDDLEVEGTVDTSTAGEYEITYKNGSLSETVKVTVKENKASLKAKDSTLYVGDTWVSKDNFVSAMDKDGNALTVSDLEVEGTVDTKTAGVYEITYKNGSLSETVKVTVKENKASLKVKDSTLYVGDKWALADNFVSATDKDGNALAVDDLEVEGTVDTSTAGVYEVTYKNGSLSETAKITVKDLNENDQTSLEVKDSTLYVGDKWEANDNFISATDKDGNTLKVTDLQIEGVVNTKNAGIYEVTYKNGNLSKIAKVTVKEKPSISTSNGEQGGKQSQDKGSTNRQGTNNTNSSLPKAGEQSTFYLSVMGILLLLSGLVMMYRRTKIKN
ncbi:TPA: BspA family leucine-rich repeat surface protein [Enterococcus faecalis]|nr:BspA family leucine-rich repeat surface protein [Enterococcus faecalis]HAP3007017.1 BspA family leucine-rich repeat surface protein [Enterococcus faecalis]